MCHVQGIQWGDVSSWVSGVATVAAIAVALYQSRRAERLAHQRDLTSVFAWFASAANDEGRGFLKMVNNTKSPIYRWRAIVEDPSDGVKVSVGDIEFGLFPPGEYSHPCNADLAAAGNDNSTRTTLVFRTADNTWRVRDGAGVLKRVSEAKAKRLMDDGAR